MKKWQFNLLLGVFAAAFLVSGFFLARYFLQIRQNEVTYSALSDIVAQARQEQSTKPTLPEGEDLEPTSPYVTVTDPETGAQVELLPEFAELYLLNNDLVGWLTIDGTNIDYPVVQDKENVDYYLYRDFYKNSSRGGCLYAKEACDVAAPTDNIVIYGHNTRGGEIMFHALNGYTSKSFWEEHPTIRFSSLKENATYEIMAVFKTTATVDQGFDYHLFVDAQTREEFQTFVDTCNELSFYDTGVEAAFGDKFITLSTCEYTLENGRLVVVAKRVGE